MFTHLVDYTLAAEAGEHRDYKPILTFLKDTGPDKLIKNRWNPDVGSTFFVQTGLTAQELLDQLKQYLDPSRDRMLVLNVDGVFWAGLNLGERPGWFMSQEVISA